MQSLRKRNVSSKLPKRMFLAPAVLALFLSGCAPATPTVDPAQIQASAVAAASTMVALTQAAVPTPTQEPPTLLPSPTELPSPTLLALPTLDTSGFPTAAPAPTTAASSGSTTDDCNHLFDVGASGNKTAGVLIQNTTKGPVTFTMGLSTKNAFGQCGYLSWSNIPKGGSVSVRVPQTGAGPCYWVYAWVNDPKQPRTLNPGISACLNNPDKWTFVVGYDTIKYITP